MPVRRADEVGEWGICNSIVRKTQGQGVLTVVHWIAWGETVVIIKSQGEGNILKGDG